MNSGFVMNGFPSIGSWISYGLGSLNEDLPTFVVLPDPRGLPAGGSINWSNGFLPAAHQGVAFRSTGEPIADLATPATVMPEERKAAVPSPMNHNNGRLERPERPHNDIASRWRKFAFHLKRSA